MLVELNALKELIRSLERSSRMNADLGLIYNHLHCMYCWADVDNRM